MINETDKETMNIPRAYKIKYLKLSEKNRERYYKAYLEVQKNLNYLKSKDKYISAKALERITENLKIRYSLIKPQSSDKMALKLFEKMLEKLKEKGYLGEEE